MHRTLAPALASLSLTLACGSGPGFAVDGVIVGTVSGGVTVSIADDAGSTLAVGTTDPAGEYLFLNVPKGSYLVTPSAPGASFVPARWHFTSRGSDVAGLDFLSTPPSSPFAVAVAGDAPSGVAAASYAGVDFPRPNADVAVYDPSTDAWTIAIRWDAPPVTGLGGDVSFRGIPAAGTFTESTSGLVTGFGPCWSASSAPGGNLDLRWVPSAFSLALSAVGPSVPTNLRGASGPGPLADYPVHGTFQATCAPAPGSPAQGTVTIDVAF